MSHSLPYSNPTGGSSHMPGFVNAEPVSSASYFYGLFPEGARTYFYGLFPEQRAGSTHPHMPPYDNGDVVHPHMPPFASP
jgi:hypothetical protein